MQSDKTVSIKHFKYKIILLLPRLFNRKIFTRVINKKFELDIIYTDDLIFLLKELHII